jgi:hypothetical protein
LKRSGLRSLWCKERPLWRRERPLERRRALCGGVIGEVVLHCCETSLDPADFTAGPHTTGSWAAEDAFSLQFSLQRVVAINSGNHRDIALQGYLSDTTQNQIQKSTCREQSAF